MTSRDWFAFQAMRLIVAPDYSFKLNNETLAHPEQLAKWCAIAYDIADAMIAEKALRDGPSNRCDDCGVAFTDTKTGRNAMRAHACHAEHR